MPSRKPNPNIANITRLPCPSSAIPNTTAGPERHLSLSGGKLERKSGLGYAEPGSPDGAAFQMVRPEIAFVAGGSRGDAEAPFVMDGEVRRPAASLQGAATGRIGKSSLHLMKGRSGVLPAKPGIRRMSRGELRHRQRCHQHSGKWPPGRHALRCHG